MPFALSDMMMNAGVFFVANVAKFRWLPLAQFVINVAMILKFETDLASVAIDFAKGTEVAVVSARKRFQVVSLVWV